MFVGIPFFDIFSLTHKEEEVWPDGTHPILFAESVVSACQSFRLVAPFFFSGKSTTFRFFLEHRSGGGGGGGGGGGTAI